jgi:thioredoxin reductase
LTDAQKAFFQKHGMVVVEEKIKALVGQNGLLERVIFESGHEIERVGGIVGIQWRQATSIGQALGCEFNSFGGIIIDEMGRTNVNGVYAAGDTSTLLQSQLIYAAANGSKAAVAVNTDLIESYFTGSE